MSSAFRTEAKDVKEFRERHQLDQAALDRLLGFSSGGRATRRWEKVGAPYYVTILMTYADTFGLETMANLAAERGA